MPLELVLTSRYNSRNLWMSTETATSAKVSIRRRGLSSSREEKLKQDDRFESETFPVPSKLVDLGIRRKSSNKGFSSIVKIAEATSGIRLITFSMRASIFLDDAIGTTQ